MLKQEEINLFLAQTKLIQRTGHIPHLALNVALYLRYDDLIIVVDGGRKSGISHSLHNLASILKVNCSSKKKKKKHLKH